MSTLKIEIDGQQTEVSPGQTVMDAARQLGMYVPHFCYHPKLSIAANCRMCLVQVEKAPKPLPACATPVTDGMKVSIVSEYAKTAQKSVMEFLLINHPLDCPICDQGGECQLQDLAVGYGKSNSRYQEPKRVVVPKSMGPLVSAEEMARCIQCTRCVRFGQEIAGQMELGMIGRGEHSEIVSFVGRAVESELSGNMIDVCPVGALTSKPFRYAARTWELGRRRSISPHDSLGSNLIVQVKLSKVMRVLPLENEELNECWLSDKDRFSYEALDEGRLEKPLVKQGGEWREVDWQTALERVAEGLHKACQKVGALGSPHATFEELYLLQKLTRALGSDNVDFRLRQSDFSADGKRKGAPWLGMKVQELNTLDRVLVVGSFLRKDHPLIANRFRQAAKKGQQFNVLHVADDDSLVKTKNRAIVRPSQLVGALQNIVNAARTAKSAAGDAKDVYASIAASLASGQKVGIFLGNSAVQHPQAAQLHALAQELAQITGGRFGFFGEAANSVGGYQAQCIPSGSGLNAAAMLAQPQSAYVLLNVEPELDCHNPRQAIAAMNKADFVVALTPFQSHAVEYADVILPITPFTETSGSFVNTEGRLQSFNPTVKPYAEARPAWKVLRVLGNLLGLQDFEQDSSEEVRDEAQRAALPLSNEVSGIAVNANAGSAALERVADVPIYFADPLARRSVPLQEAPASAAPKAYMNAALIHKLGVVAGQLVKVKQEGGEALIEAELDDRLADGCVRVAAAHSSTADLGAMFGEISVERA
ncbi:MAG TPA: NADH-quinone oxidoreductase subunit NuoG [Burkholderiales bacterium]|nr:NADH-quinone oxidoreductase subunit NuoG [Burkholderiales bacterium]